MDLSYKITIDEEKPVIGIVRCREGCTFAEIRDEIVDDGIVEYPFDFIHDGVALNPKQEKKWKVYTTLLGIKRKLDTFDVETRCSNAVEAIPIFENIEENVEEPMHKQPRVENMPLSVEEATIVDSCVLASWEKKVKSLMEEFVNEKLTLKVYSEKGESKIKIHCEICGIDYGTGDVSLVARTMRNFKNHHMKTTSHQQRLSMPSGSEIPSCKKVQQTTVVGDRFHIDQAIKLLDDFNKTQEPNLFKVVEATLADYKDMKKVRVECTRCNKWFCLVPTSGNIVSSLNEHMKSKKHTTTTTNEASHQEIGLRSGIVGRPKKPTNDKSQQSLTRFLVPSSPSVLHRGSTSATPTSGVLISG